MLEDGVRGNSYLKRISTPIDFTPEMIQEYIKCAGDPIYFAKKYIKIVHVDRGLVPFEMYPYQEELVELFKNNRRVVCLMARQAGKTSTAVAVILHYILFNTYKTVALLANKGDTAREILSRIKLAYETLPKWIQQGVVDWNKGSILLENGCKVFAGATTSSSIRGVAASLIYIDECIVGSETVVVRNKKTGLVEKIPVEELYLRLESNK